MAAEKWTREKRRALTRDALVQAAAEVIAQKGFEKASLEEIAEAAGFTRGAIYKNFENKTDLFFAALDADNEHLLGEFADAVGSAQSLAELEPTQIAQLWRGVMLSDRNMNVLWAEARNYATRHPEFRERWNEIRHREVVRVRDYIERQLAAFGLRATFDLEEFADMLYAASTGFYEEELVNPGGPDLFTVFLDIVIGALVHRLEPIEPDPG